MRQFVKTSFTAVSMRHSVLLGLIFMVLSVPAAYAGIADSLHNLGTSNTNPAGSNAFTGTGEICVFCHTPHGGDTTQIVPLWNRTLGVNVYQTYDQLGTSTLDGEVATVGSVSIACLSCHDGTQALDAIINESGSGLDNATWNAGTWSGDNVVNATGLLEPLAITNIGLDLRDDHPVGIQYGGGGIDSGNINGAMNDLDFFQPTPVLVGTTQTWYLDANASGTRDKQDVILYTRPSADFAGGGTTEPSVECASCHDPHQTANPTFLRVTSTGSQICLTCHNK